VRLTVTMGKGLRVSAPLRVSMRELPKFIHEKSDWVLDKLDQFEKLERKIHKQRYRIGSKVLFLGKPYIIRVYESSSKKTRITMNGRELEMYLPKMEFPEGRERYLQRLVWAWYRIQARKVIGHRVLQFASIMRVKPGAITIKKQRSRWGSCSAEGNLNFNLLLMMMPPRVLDYVIIHELAHLVELNHSPKYWSIVDAYCPQRKACQHWLKYHNHYLEA